tara:strand:+ start:1027 stop:1542 length:516 start_codon:yes stop_codon:yes gene_type:complete
MQQAFFLLFAGLAVLSALMVVTRKDVVHSAVFLISTLFWVAAIYVLLRAEFLAAIQVLVYAGAIMVLVLFTVLLIQMEGVRQVNSWHRQRPLVLVLGLILLGEVFFVISRSLFPNALGEFSQEKVASIGGNTEAFGQLLFTKYLFPFEVASILLLAAMIGAIVLAKKEIEK